MKVYRAKEFKLSGSDFHEVHVKAFALYQKIKRKTKRRPYVRSAYFKKSKVFLDLYWHHLFEKSNWRDRARRSRYFPAAVELIKNSRFEPISKENPNKTIEILHRFAGTTKDNNLFFVQIKEDKKSGKKWLMSVFPAGDK